MNPVYNLAISLYSLGARLLAVRDPKVRKMVEGQRDTLGRIADFHRRAAVRVAEKWVWIHAASLGEFEQGRPLIERIKSTQPETRVLLTFFSPSGYEVRRDYDKADIVCYLPFDRPALVRSFLDAVSPSMAIFVKYEFWGNYLSELRRRGVPVYLISAIFRKGQIFFRPWGGMFRRMLRCYTHLYVQDENSRRLLASIGIDNVTVAGDTRLDRVTDIMRAAAPIDSVRHFATGDDTILVAGSSWEPDEDIYIPWLKANRRVKSIIAPHEFDDRRIAALIARLGADGEAMALSTYEEIFNDNPDDERLAKVRHLVVDCFGRLSSIYRYGSIAYIGGGFGVGIHNINEAAVYGMPVIFGPNHHKFKEAADLIACGGGFSVNDAGSLASILDRLTGSADDLDKAGRAAADYISRSTGATDIIFDDLFSSHRR